MAIVVPSGQTQLLEWEESDILPNRLEYLRSDVTSLSRDPAVFVDIKGLQYASKNSLA